MKKTLIKITLFFVINLLLSTIAVAANGLSATGDSATEKIGDLFSDVKECVPLDSKNEEFKQANEFIITPVEEPIGKLNGEKIKFAGNDNCYKQNDEFYICTCFRNTARYIINKKLITKSEVSTDCSKKAQSLLDDPELTDKKVGYRYSCSEIQMIFSKGGLSMISSYIGMLYGWAAGLVGLIAVTVIIISGLQLSLSGGDSSAIESAKKRIVQSIAGIIVLFLSGVILYTINPTFFSR